MKYCSYILVFLLFWGCSEKPKHSEFSYEEAIVLFQSEIIKMEDGPMKNGLLWHTERILEQDTLYKQKLSSSMYDSLMLSLVRYKALKHVRRQLYLDQLELLTVVDSMEAYKFHYNRAFSNDEVVISVSKQRGGQNTIMWQVISAVPDCNPLISKKAIDGSCFRVKLNESRAISNKEWNTLINLIDETKFWELSSTIDNYGFDGSNWTIEGSKNLKDSSGVMQQIYHSVSRWSPAEGTPIYEIGKYLLSTKDYKWGRIY